MPNLLEACNRLRSFVDRGRLLHTAVELVEVPSPTRSAGAVADRLAEILAHDGFQVERPLAGWPEAPAVAVRFAAPQPGLTLQFNGHLDTVHLPFVPPRLENGMLYGSGSVDMKGGVAALVEALRVLRDTGLLTAGQVLLTAHDLHESPWGDGSQLDALIDAGYVGDAVLIPEYLNDRLAVVGRGMSVIELCVTRPGEPVHEVLGGIEQPSVILTGARFVQRLADLDRELSAKTHPIGLRESAFIGQITAGEIYNQSPTELRLAGTRRWLPGTSADEAEQQLHELAAETAAGTGTDVEVVIRRTRDAYEISPDCDIARVFQSVCRTVLGHELPVGPKPFVDDGNTFSNRGTPTITYGPGGRGAHTLHEEVPIDGLERTALMYALTAIAFCSREEKRSPTT